MLIRVEQAKGRKDRHAMLSPQLLAVLRAWWLKCRQTLPSIKTILHDARATGKFHMRLAAA